MGEFVMPSLGADMDKGTIVEWRVKPGDVVKKGDIVAVVDTEKSNIEVEIFEPGVIEQILVGEGEEVPVGAVLAIVGTGGGVTISPPISPAPAVVPSASEPVPPPPVPPPAPPPIPEPPVPPPEPMPFPEPPVPPPQPAPIPEPPFAPAVVSPVVRHLAEQLGVDVATVKGTGPAGRVRRADVERARPAPAGRPRSSPYARRRAAELGVDLATVRGSGPGGAVVATDLTADVTADLTAPAPASAAPSTPAPAAPPVEKPVAKAAPSKADKQAAMRHAIGALMGRSKREIPHYYLHHTIDMAAAMAWLDARNADRAVTERVLPAALLLKAAALTCRDMPGLNGFWIDDAFQPADHVHLGVAISLRGGGLIAPAIHDADTLDLDALMAALRDLVNRARAGTLRSSEMADPTITVTNLGDQGVEAVYGVIYPPQVALVGFGAVVERPWAVDGLIGVRPLVTATLSADHRASDGHLGARYLRILEQRLQEPDQL